MSYYDTNSMEDKMFEILKMASIRKLIDENFPEGIYFDVFERVNLPSPEGDYADYDAVITCQSKAEKTAMENLFGQVENAKVAIVLL